MYDNGNWYPARVVDTQNSNFHLVSWDGGDSSSFLVPKERLRFSKPNNKPGTSLEDTKAFYSDQLFLASNQHPLFSIGFAHQCNDLTRADSLLVEASVIFSMLFKDRSGWRLNKELKPWGANLDPLINPIAAVIMSLIVDLPPSMLEFKALRLSLGCPILRKSIGRVEPAYVCRGFQSIMRLYMVLWIAYITCVVLWGFIQNDSLLQSTADLASEIMSVVTARMLTYSIWFPQNMAMSVQEWRKQKGLRMDPRDPPEESAMRVFAKALGLWLAYSLYCYGALPLLGQIGALEKRCQDSSRCIDTTEFAANVMRVTADAPASFFAFHHALGGGRPVGGESAR